MAGSSVGIKRFRFRGLPGTGRGAAMLAAAAVCLLLAPPTARAASVNPSDGQISAAQQAASAAAAQVGQITAQLVAAQTQVAHAQAAANIALGRSETTQADYQNARLAAQKAKDAARQAEAARADAQAKVATFARSSYIQGSTSPGFAAALTSDGPVQMLERTALLAAATSHRTDVLGQMTTAQHRAAAADDVATIALDRAGSIQQQAQAELTAATTLEISARQQNSALQAQQSQLTAQLQTAQQTLLGLQGARAVAVADEQRQASARAAASSVSRGPSSIAVTTNSGGNASAARTAINAAMAYVGQMYAWGGGSLAGPSEGWGPDVGVIGFDCSGLTRYAYAQAGISIPRVASDQYTGLPKVANLQPGDLVFWATDPSDAATIHHVAMYLGGGQVVEAPESGQRVKVVPMWYGFEYIGAVRPSA